MFFRSGTNYKNNKWIHTKFETTDKYILSDASGKWALKTHGEERLTSCKYLNYLDLETITCESMVIPSWFILNKRSLKFVRTDPFDYIWGGKAESSNSVSTSIGKCSSL